MEHQNGLAAVPTNIKSVAFQVLQANRCCLRRGVKCKTKCPESSCELSLHVKSEGSARQRSAHASIERKGESQ